MPKFVNLIAFLQKLISKEHVVVIMEFPDWVQVKMKIIYNLKLPVFKLLGERTNHSENEKICREEFNPT